MLERIPTHIPNLDAILGGGLPANSVTLISGTPGSGKTVLANQFLYGNASQERKALFVTTVSEPMARLVRYTQEFSFFDPEKAGKAVLYEDLGPKLLDNGNEDALGYVANLVMDLQPAFLVVDSIRAVHDLSPNVASARRGLFRLVAALTTLPCTALLIGEYHPDEVAHTVEASIADVILHLQHRALGLREQRVLNVFKMRASEYLPGDHTFKISADGITAFPRFITPREPVKYNPSRERAVTGIPGFDDELFPGGLLRGTSTLLAGDPGVGKTVTALHFLLNGAKGGDPGVYISFQEDPSQLARIAENFGFDVAALEADDRLKMLYASPVELDVNEHAIQMVEAVRAVDACRVVIDSVSDLAAGADGDPERFFNFIFSLVQWLKDRGVTALLTAEMGSMFANELTLTGRGVSHIADNLLMLRYTEMDGEIHRALTALAARGSDHSKEVREYLISEKEGPRLGGPLTSAYSMFAMTKRGEG